MSTSVKKGCKKSLKTPKFCTEILRDKNSWYIELQLIYRYRVPHLKPYNSRRLFFHLTNNFLMFKMRFYILQIWPFYNISSFFDLCKTLFHKSVFFKKNFFFDIFFSNTFFCILWIINWCLKYVFICTRLWSFMIYYRFLV